MKHNLKTFPDMFWGMIPKTPLNMEVQKDYEIERYKEVQTKIIQWRKNLTEELQQPDFAVEFCIKNGFGKLQAIVLRKFIQEEILGLSGTDNESGSTPTKEGET